MVRHITCIIVMFRCRPGHAMVRLTTCIIVLLPMEFVAQPPPPPPLEHSGSRREGHRRDGLGLRPTNATTPTRRDFISWKMKTDCHALSNHVIIDAVKNTRRTMPPFCCEGGISNPPH